MPTHRVVLHRAECAAAHETVPLCLQTSATTLLFPLGLSEVYGTGQAWAFGGTWLT